MPRHLPAVLEQYAQAVASGDKALLRALGTSDLFFLLRILCRRADMEHQWVLERCDEVQVDPDGHLDLWPREHFKSSVITFGKSLQDILADPEVTIGIFSHTRPIAKGFLRQLKREMEANEVLKELYPDVLWSNPGKEAPTWSEDSGLVVRRSRNPKESSVEAWGLVDGQPTSKHFDVLNYDDTVTRENAASPEMREKTLKAYEDSLNLGVRNGRKRMLGTRYHYADIYAPIMERGTFIPRIHRAYDEAGNPTLLTAGELDAKRRDMGSFTFSSQMMLDPKAEGSFGFVEQNLRHYDGRATGNTYLVVDPANSKKKRSDYTAIWVVTVSADGNYYVRWLLRDKLSLSERIETVLWAHREYQPSRVGYEQYGAQADIEAIRMEQERQTYRFEVVPLGGQLSKQDRIMQLVPLFEAGKIYLPHTLHVQCKEDGLRRDMVHAFVQDEYKAWPYSSHDDMLDCLARIVDPDLGVIWPKPAKRADPYESRGPRRARTTWMAA